MVVTAKVKLVVAVQLVPRPPEEKPPANEYNVEFLDYLASNREVTNKKRRQERQRRKKGGAASAAASPSAAADAAPERDF